MLGSAGGWCGALAALWILALPLAVAPWFHSEFAAPKLLLLAALGIPLTLALLWRGRHTAPLAPIHRLLLLLLPTFAIAALRDASDAAQWAQALALLAAPLVALHIGASSGGTLPALRALARALGTAALLVLAVGLVRRHTELLAWIPDRADVAFSATLGNSNEVAEFAAPIAVLLLLLPRAGIADYLLFVAALALTGLSESRAGFLAVALGLVVGAVVLLRTAGAVRRKGLLLLYAAVLLLTLLALLPHLAPLRQRILSSFDSTHPTNTVRLHLYEATTQLIGANLPFGVGPGRFEETIPQFRSAEEWRASGVNTALESPHNEVLFAAAEAGVVGLAVCLGLVLLCWLRWRRLSGSAAEARAALAGVFVACSVFVLVRSPLHHAAGTLALGLCAGWVFAATASPRPARWSTAASAVLLLVALLGAAALAHENYMTGRARRQLVAFDHHVRHQAQADAMDAVQDCAATVAQLAQAPFSNNHAYRTALVARELAALGHALEDLGTRPEWLDHAQESTRKLIAHVRLHEPMHLAARLLEAEELLLLRKDQLRPEAERAAEALLRATLQTLPAAPGTSAMLAAVLRRIGTQDLLHAGAEATALQWLLPSQHSESALLDAAREADLAARGTEALELALCVLANDACHPDALNLVIRHGYAARTETELALANRATARAKLAIAIQALDAGDAAAATRNLQLALSRDPNLAPAHLLTAKIALLRSDSAAANAAVTTLRSLQISAGAIRAACAADAVLAPALAAGTIDPALR